MVSKIESKESKVKTQVIGDNYTIIYANHLGHGGFGQIYEGNN